MTRVPTLPFLPALAALALAALALGGCASATDPGPSGGTTPKSSESSGAGGGTVAATDGSFSLQLPDGWSSQEKYLQGTIVVAAQGEDEVDQVLVSTFAEPHGAEDQAIYTATGLADGGISCERIEDSTAYGDPRLVFDCPQTAHGSTVRKLFLPVEHDGSSVLVFVQTAGKTLADTTAVVRPMVESLTWK